MWNITNKALTQLRSYNNDPDLKQCFVNVIKQIKSGRIAGFHINTLLGAKDADPNSPEGRIREGLIKGGLDFPSDCFVVYGELEGPNFPPNVLSAVFYLRKSKWIIYLQDVPRFHR